MKNRPCVQSDLRLTVDVRVDTSGRPLAEDVAAFVADPIKFYEPPDTPKGTGAFYWCVNEECLPPDNIFYSHAAALEHLQGDPLDGGWPGYAGIPRRGRVSEQEAAVVREHLAEVNTRLKAGGLRQIDPTNPKHAKRYGLSNPGRGER